MELSEVTLLFRRACAKQLWSTTWFLVLILVLGLVISNPTITNSRSSIRTAANSAEGQAPLRVVRWQRPGQGWIYVLDPNNGNENAEVLLVDPNTGTVQGILETGYDPDFAVSHDGTRLYVVSGHSWLSVFDTQNETVLSSVRVPNRAMYTVLPYISSLAVSPQDKWLYIATVDETGPHANFNIAIFDAVSERFLDEDIALPDCGTARLLPGPEEGAMAVHCIDTNDVRRLRLASNGTVTSENRIALPSNRRTSDVAQKLLYRAALVFQSGGQGLGVVMGDGTTFSGSLVDHANFTKAMAGSVGQCVPTREWPVSSDGSRVYVGISPCDEYVGTGYVSDIAIFDAMSLVELERTTVAVPFWSLAQSHDGAIIFASSPATHSLLVLDANSLREIRRIEGVGKTPTLLMIAP